MSWIAVLLVFLTVIAAVMVKLSQSQKAQLTGYPYRKLDSLFSPAERSFLGVLNKAVGENALIFGKVRVADVLAPQKGMSRSDWQKSFNKISGKHFDFLLCSKNDLSALCAIELNDSSHNSKKRIERDKFLEGSCQSANMPLIQITAKSTYSIVEIQQSLSTYLPGHLPINSTQKPVSTMVTEQAPNNKKSCPKCSSILVKRVTKKGKNIGNEFLACSAYPKCKYIEAIHV